MSTPEWAPEKVVDLELARALVVEQFPEYAGVTPRPLGQGWDNTVYAFGDEVTFRFPRREIALGLLETERAVLGRVGAQVPLRVPELRHVGAPSERFSWPFLGLAHVAGTTACRSEIDDETRTRSASVLAAFLRALHALDGEAMGAPLDTFHRADLGKRRAKLERGLAECEALGVAAARDFQGVLDAIPERRAPRPEVLCHGDLYPRHLMVDDAGGLVGVIDWGDAHRGDRIKDLACAFLFLPAQGRQMFRDAYGDIDDEEWAAARALALFHATIEVAYGVDTGDEDMRQIGLRGLRYVREG